MVKKILLIICSVLLLAIFGCQKSEQKSMDHKEGQESFTIHTNNGYDYLYDTSYLTHEVSGLSLKDLVQIHEMIASVYKYRSQLHENWANRESYTLNRTDFLNEYIFQETKMTLYECVRYLSPDESDYTEPLPYIKSIRIEPFEIMEENGLFVIPVIVDSRTSKDPGYEDTKEQFFIVKKEGQKFVIANFIYGYEFDKDLEIFSNVSEFTKEDWSRSIYSEEGRSKIDPKEKEFLDSYVEFIQSNEPKEEYLKNWHEKNNNILINEIRGTYNNAQAVWYATYYNDNSGTCSTTSYNPAYIAFSNADCANFVSQCIKHGGFTNISGSSGSCNAWYYYNQGTSTTSDDTYSNSWSTANGLKRYLYDCGQYTTVVYPSDLWTGTNIIAGDVFFMADPPPQSGQAPYYTHSMVVTNIANSQIYYSAHCNNRINRSMHSNNYNYWFTNRWTRGFHITHTNN